MNKYLAQSRQAQARRRRERTCANKTAYPTPEAAAQHGHEHYHCPYCHQWHRTCAMVRLLARVRGRRRPPPFRASA